MKKRAKLSIVFLLVITVSISVFFTYSKKDTTWDTDFISCPIKNGIAIIPLKNFPELGTESEAIINLQYSLPEYQPELLKKNGEIFVRIHLPKYK